VVRKGVKIRRFPHGLLRFIDSSPVAGIDNLDMVKRWLTAGREIKVSEKVEARLINDEKGHAWFVKRYRSRSLFRVLLALLGWTRGGSECSAAVSLSNVSRWLSTGFLVYV